MAALDPSPALVSRGSALLSRRGSLRAMNSDALPPPAAVELTIEARTRDIDGFSVGRVLPSAQRRMVGPFIFFDHMGPNTLAAGEGIAVRPHPHIELATVTYLFEGEIDHRDSLGVHQTIRPGELNLMIAGKGIVHSERTGPEARARGGSVDGIQLWLALPDEHARMEPSFEHHPVEVLPRIEHDGVVVRVLLGELLGQRSPARCLSPLLYAEAHMEPGSCLALPIEHPERALYVASGSVAVGGEPVQARRMLVFGPGPLPEIRAEAEAHVLIVAGEPVGPRHIFWNFVSASRERIEQAKRDWTERRFPIVPGDEEEWIPLPE